MVCDSTWRNPTLQGFPFQNGFRDWHFFFSVFPEVDRIIYLDDLNSSAKISEVNMAGSFMPKKYLGGAEDAIDVDRMLS